MSKNYFTKNLMSASMLLAVSMGMASCSGFVDAVLGTTDTPTTQPTTQPTTPTTPTSSAVVTADQTTITTSSLADLANAVTSEQKTELENAIKAKAAAGEVYTLNIKSEQPLSTENFEGFEIPREEGSKINLVIEQPILTTEESPLKITAAEKKSETSTTPVQEVTVTLPAGPSPVYVCVDTPEATVTLEGDASYEYVEALTATNTLYIKRPVKNLNLKGGSVVVMAGGSIETLVCPTSSKVINISSDGVGGKTFWYSINDDKGNPYYVDNLKIIKGDAEYATLVHNIDVNKLFKKLIIADGAAVNYKNGEDIRIETIEGQGNAKFLYGVSFEQDGKMVYTGNCDLRYVKNINKVAFMPLWKDKVEWTSIQSIPNNAQNSLFEAMSIYSLPNTYEFNSYTVTNNTYNFTEYFNILIPGQSSSRSSFAFKFDRCKFSNNAKLDVVLNESEPVYNADGTPKMIYPYIDATGNYHVAYAKSEIPSDCQTWWESQDSNPITFSGYKGTVEFNKCKYGSDDIKKDTPFLTKGLFWESNIDLKFIIDGTTYTPIYGSSTSGSTSVDITLN